MGQAIEETALLSIRHPGRVPTNVSVTADNGYADFSFSFYQHGTYGTPSENAITLQNVQVTGGDIDFRQFNAFSNIQSFTLSDPTRLTPSNPNPTFPADVNFQGPEEGGDNDPRDQVVVTYGQFSTTTIRAGATSVSGAFFAFTFGALGSARIRRARSLAM